ncbi:MAG: hypothetical protein WBP82_09165 [Leuconostoc mesenteroides]
MFTIKVIHEISLGDSFLLENQRQVLKELKEIQLKLKEIEKNTMTTQQRIDALTAQVTSNDADARAALQEESAEIQEAIASTEVNTAGLEAAIANSTTLPQSIRDLFTPAAPEGEEPV